MYWRPSVKNKTINKLAILVDLALADFRERTRRYSFLVLLGGVVYFGYLVGSGIYTPTFSGYRGVANCAWIGASMALAGTIVLCFFGFYFINTSIHHDRRTGVGEIMATTQISRQMYIFSKFTSNLAVLSVIVGILAVAAFAVYEIKGVDGGFNAWALLSPFLLVSLPAIAFVAAMAVFFESARWLRGGIGNIAYLLLVIIITIRGIEADSFYPNLQGFRFLESSMRAACVEASPDARLYMGSARPDAKPFRWEGTDWTLDLVIARVFWVGVALLVALLAGRLFDRFDPATAGRGMIPPKPNSSSVSKGEAVVTVSNGAPIYLSRLDTLTYTFSFLRMLEAELRLALKGYHLSWYIVAVGLLVAQLSTPYQICREFIFPAAWLWPILVWSSMGTREKRFNTDQLMFSSAFPLTRQLPATWMAGILVAALTGAGMAIRAWIIGDWMILVSWAVGVFFIPTLALTLGTLSGTNKLFEIIYLTIWYIGPMNRVAGLDFMGVTEVAAESGVQFVFLAITIVLIPLMIIARRRQTISC